MEKRQQSLSKFIGGMRYGNVAVQEEDLSNELLKRITDLEAKVKELEDRE